MGFFDYVYADGPEFCCDQGHHIGEMQTKDLGETMGRATIVDGDFVFHHGGYGDPPDLPLTATIDVYGHCTECPAFVQAKTMNLRSFGVSFDVEIVADGVVKVTRTSETLAQFLAREPGETHMKGCFGPMPYDAAYQMHCYGRSRFRRDETEAGDAD